jgi:integrase
MPRTGNIKPWWRADRRRWYATLGGRQVDLGPDHAAAVRALERLLAAARGEAGVERGPTLGDVCGAFLADWERRVQDGQGAPGTLAHYRSVLGLPPDLERLPAAKLAPGRVDDWLAGQAVGAATRRSRGRILKAAVRWAWMRGDLDADPLERWRPPAGRCRRKRLPTEAEVERFVAACGAALRPLVELVRDTGCRPCEARTLAGCHLCGDRAVMSEHKTSRKTGRDRVIWLPGDWPARLADLAAVRVAGPLLRNARGGAWDAKTLSAAFRRARDRAGLPADWVGYGLRHRRISRLLADGVPVAIVAAIAGHANASTTLATYDLCGQDEAAIRRALAG